MRLWSVLGCLAFLACAAGCAPRNKAYPGPVLTQEKLGLVVPARQTGYSTKYVAILEINGADEIEEWQGGGSSDVHLLPGDYEFRVEFKQHTQKTTIFILDLVALIGDATAAAEHEEATLGLRVKAGMAYRVHYKENGHAYFVSVTPGAATTEEEVPVTPPPDAFECVAAPDRTADLWCALARPAE